MQLQPSFWQLVPADILPLLLRVNVHSCKLCVEICSHGSVVISHLETLPLRRVRGEQKTGKVRRRLRLRYVLSHVSQTWVTSATRVCSLLIVVVAGWLADVDTTVLWHGDDAVLPTWHWTSNSNIHSHTASLPTCSTLHLISTLPTCCHAVVRWTCDGSWWRCVYVGGGLCVCRYDNIFHFN